MRKWRWLSTFIIAFCLIGQLISFSIEEAPLSEEGENILTAANTTGVISECLLSEAPLANQITKANAVLASSRLQHRHLCQLSPANTLAIYSHSNAETPALLFRRSADNRGPPLS